MLSRALTTRLSTTDLISWALTRATMRLRRRSADSKTICLPRQFCKCWVMSSTHWISSPRSVGSRWRSPVRLKASSRSVMFLQRNASSWIIFRYLRKTSCSSLVGRRRMAAAVAEPGFQGFAAKGDAGQRVVDLVGHAGGQEADAGQPFRAHQLPAALVDLPGQVAVHVVQPAGHVVEGRGQVLHFVAAVDVDAMIEIAPGHPADARFQIADGIARPRHRRSASDRPSSSTATMQVRDDKAHGELVIRCTYADAVAECPC